MKLTLIKDELEPININEIEEFEAEIGFEIPLEYKKFLLENNGAITGNEIFKFKYYCTPDESDDEYWDWKIRLHEFNSLEVLKYCGFDKEEENPDRKYLRISTLDGGSEVIYLSLNNETYGYIYWADKTHGYKFTLIANTLDEFLNGFIENPEGPDAY